MELAIDGGLISEDKVNTRPWKVTVLHTQKNNVLEMNLAFNDFNLCNSQTTVCSIV